MTKNPGKIVAAAMIAVTLGACGASSSTTATTTATTAVASTSTAATTVVVTTAVATTVATTVEVTTKMSLSEAFCSDLRSGLSMNQIYAGVSKQYTLQKFADLAYGFAAISCKTELTTNAGLRSFLQAWGINPDA